MSDMRSRYNLNGGYIGWIVGGIIVVVLIIGGIYFASNGSKTNVATNNKSTATGMKPPTPTAPAPSNPGPSSPPNQGR